MQPCVHLSKPMHLYTLTSSWTKRPNRTQKQSSKLCVASSSSSPAPACVPWSWRSASWTSRSGHRGTPNIRRCAGKLSGDGVNSCTFTFTAAIARHIDTHGVSHAHADTLMHVQYTRGCIYAHLKALSDVQNRKKALTSVAELIEEELTILGGTAIEDKLQVGVPACVANLVAAEIKVTT